MNVSCVAESFPGEGILDREAAAFPSNNVESVSGENIHLDRLARARLRVLDSIAEGIYQVDSEGYCTFMNRSACCMLGYRFGKALGKNMHELHDNSAEAVAAAQERREAVFRRTDGSRFPVECCSHQVFDSGVHLGTVITFRDLTERAISQGTVERQSEDLRRSAEALRHQTRLVNSIVTSTAEGIIAVDEKGDIILYNPAAAGMLGEQCASTVPDANKLENLGFSLYLPDQRTPCPPEQMPLIRAIQGETVDGLELFVKTPQRPEGFWLNGTARPMMDDEGFARGGFLVFRDVSEQKTSREVLRRAKDEAETANRAKSDFLSRMSHELRTPMNAILGFAQLLEDEALTGEQRDAIVRILRAARHLLGLINEVLDISRIEAGRLNLQIEHLRPFEVMQSAIELMIPLASQRKIDLVAPLPSDVRWYIDADRQRLMQVFVNLLGNAVKYNHEGGQVKVSFEETEARTLRVKVADTGPGLAPEQLSKLFIPFERLGAERSGIEGTGIGLAYSQRLMTAMGGSIGVASEVGKGSVFWTETSLSVAEQHNESNFLRSTSDVVSEVSFDVGLATVLCIQDDPATFRQIETIFGRLPGYEVVSAERGRVGIRMALGNVPELVLLDLQLPDVDGIEVLKELRRQKSTRRTPIVVVSADLTDNMRCRALDAGAHSCLDKPLQVRQFLDTIVCLL